MLCTVAAAEAIRVTRVLTVSRGDKQRLPATPVANHGGGSALPGCVTAAAASPAGNVDRTVAGAVQGPRCPAPNCPHEDRGGARAVSAARLAESESPKEACRGVAGPNATAAWAKTAGLGAFQAPTASLSPNWQPTPVAWVSNSGQHLPRAAALVACCCHAQCARGCFTSCNGSCAERRSACRAFVNLASGCFDAD